MLRIEEVRVAECFGETDNWHQWIPESGSSQQIGNEL